MSVWRVQDFINEESSRLVVVADAASPAPEQAQITAGETLEHIPSAWIPIKKMVGGQSARLFLIKEKVCHAGALPQGTSQLRRVGGLPSVSHDRLRIAHARKERVAA